MATASLTGNAGLRYTPESTELTHRLAAPLLDVDGVQDTLAEESLALDRKTRYVVRLVSDGNEIEAIEATIRFENQPGNLKNLIRASRLDGVAVRYHADLSEAATWTARIWRVVGERYPGHIPLARDRERFGFGEWEVRLEFRRTDGNSFDTWLSP